MSYNMKLAVAAYTECIKAFGAVNSSLLNDPQDDLIRAEAFHSCALSFRLSMELFKADSAEIPQF